MEQKVTKHELPKLIETVKKSLKQITINPTFFGIFLAFSIVSTLLMYLGAAAAPGFVSSNSDAGPMFFVAVLFYVLGYMILAGPLTAYSVAAARNESKSTKELFGAVRYILPLLVAGIIAGLIILFGLILLIIPGIILAAKLLFPNYLIVDSKLGPIKAIKESFRMTKGHVLSLLKYLVIIFLASILVSMVVSQIPILGSVVTNLMSLFVLVVFAHLYLSLKDKSGEKPKQVTQN